MSEDEDVQRIISDALIAEMQRKRSLPEMSARLAEYCVNIESNQSAWITGGLYIKPDPREIERLADLQQIYNFIEACRTRPDDVISRLRRSRAA